MISVKEPVFRFGKSKASAARPAKTELFNFNFFISKVCARFPFLCVAGSFFRFATFALFLFLGIFFPFERDLFAIEDHPRDETDHKHIQPKQEHDDGAERAVEFVHIAYFKIYREPHDRDRPSRNGDDRTGDKPFDFGLVWTYIHIQKQHERERQRDEERIIGGKFERGGQEPRKQKRTEREQEHKHHDHKHYDEHKHERAYTQTETLFRAVVVVDEFAATAHLIEEVRRRIERSDQEQEGRARRSVRRLPPYVVEYLFDRAEHGKA